jgi:hypothetical protein
MCDVWIVSWFPLCSQPPGEGRGEDEKRPGWVEFLVSCPFPQSIPFGLGSPRTLMRVSAIILSGLHHQPESKSVLSSSCRPLLVLRLHFQVPHRPRPPTASMTRQGNMRSGRLTSHTSRTTNFLLLGLWGTCAVHQGRVGLRTNLTNGADGIYISPTFPATSTRSVTLLLSSFSFPIFSQESPLSTHS